MKIFGIIIILICSVSWPVYAVEWSGYIAAETRVFTQSPQHVNQEDNDAYALIIEPEIRYTRGVNTYKFIPFYLEDSVDEERSHFDVREFFWRHNKTDWELLVGINRVFWGVAESRHLVDIINQTDLVVDIDTEDKLGQPMVQYSLFRNWGNLGLFVLPGFRERTFPGSAGRLRTALPVDSRAAVYESDKKDDHIDYAARYAHVLGDWDVGFSYFYGTSREPRFMINSDATRLLPVYDIINQAGADIQYTHDAWLWKFEGIYREGQGNSFAALVAGFEYTIFQIAQSQKDLGILLEWHYDDRDQTAAPSSFDNDVFIGARLGFNNTDDTAILAGVVLDNSGKDRFFSIEAETRLSSHLKLEMIARFFSQAESGSLIESIEQDDYIQVQLQYHL